VVQESRYCEHCGTAIGTSARFCGTCGRAVGDEGHTETEATLPQEPDARHSEAISDEMVLSAYQAGSVAVANELATLAKPSPTFLIFTDLKLAHLAALHFRPNTPETQMVMDEYRALVEEGAVGSPAHLLPKSAAFQFEAGCLTIYGMASGIALVDGMVDPAQYAKARTAGVDLAVDPVQYADKLILNFDSRIFRLRHPRIARSTDLREHVHQYLAAIDHARADVTMDQRLLEPALTFADLCYRGAEDVPGFLYNATVVTGVVHLSSVMVGVIGAAPRLEAG
jgi:hypothetical protein